MPIKDGVNIIPYPNSCKLSFRTKVLWFWPGVPGVIFFNTRNFPLKCEKNIDIFMASLKLLSSDRLISYVIPTLTNPSPISCWN